MPSFELRRNDEAPMEVIVAPEPMDYEIRGVYRFATLREGSGLAEAVRDQWPENPRLLMIAAEPESDTYTENLAMDLATALVKADLPFPSILVHHRACAWKMIGQAHPLSPWRSPVMNARKKQCLKCKELHKVRMCQVGMIYHHNQMSKGPGWAPQPPLTIF